MTQRPWNCICNSPQHQAFSKCLQMINSLEIGKMILETMLISEMALLWETVFSREVPSIAGFSGPVTSLFIGLICSFVYMKCHDTLPDMWLRMSHSPTFQGPIVGLATGIWTELSEKCIIGPVVRKLARWSPGSSPDYNPLESLKSGSSLSSACSQLEYWLFALLMRMN